MIRPAFIVALLLALALALATSLQPEARHWRKRSGEGGLMGMLFGDGRRLFANQFTAKADQYFHSGYYPSIFDQRPESGGAQSGGHIHDENCQHEEEKPAVHVHDEHCNHEKEPVAEHVHDDSCSHEHDPKGACAQGCNHGQPDEHSVAACEEKAGGWDAATDWIARFGRNFRITEHTHLEGNQQRELLPWLKISAELDPHQINTYLVASYWLRKTDKSQEAEQFIREGLEANPQNCELLLELGQIYLRDRKNVERAQNLFEVALTRWEAQEQPQEKPDLILLANIAGNLARIEEEKGQLEAAIRHLERARQASPQSAELAKQIEELKLKLPPANTNR